MKKILATAVAVLMLAATMASCASSGSADAIDDYTPENLTTEANGETFTYESAAGDAVILANFESKKTHNVEVTVPATVELEGTTRRVIGIGDEAFKGLSSITKVTLAASVTSIGDFAFADCIYLESVVFEEGSQLATVGEAAFYQCTALKSIDFSDTRLKTLDKSAFDSCTALETVALGDTLTSVGKAAFYGCSALKALTLPDTVTTVAELAFFGCSSMETLVMSNGITEMTDRALLLTKDAYLADKVDLTKLNEDTFAYKLVAGIVYGETTDDVESERESESATESESESESVTDAA